MKIFIVDDEIKLTQSLQKGFEELENDVMVAFDGEEALKILTTNKFDIIVSDVMMPKINGYELIKSLRFKHNIYTPIILLSALDTIDEKVDGLEAGADDYLAKPFSFKELVARVNALYRRFGPKNNANILKYADLELNTDTKIFTRNGGRIELTPKEFSLIEYFMRNPERVIPKAELSEKVWEIDFDTNTNVVEVYMNYLRNKMDKQYDKKLIHTQFGIGYLLTDK